MDSHSEIPTVGSGSPGLEEFQKQGGNGWSKEYDCETINGFLAPTPLNMFVPDNAEGHVEHVSSNCESSKRKRTAEEPVDQVLFFTLFKLANLEDQYMLETHEARTGNRVDISRLYADKSTRKCKVMTNDLSLGTYVVVPVTEDPSSPLTHPQGVSLQERLSGWTVVKRKRNNGKWDKFYYHGGRQYRSFVEVTTYIIFSTKTRTSRPNSNNKLVVVAPAII